MDNRIRQLRQKLGLSLEELARRANTTNQQISHLETGKRRLTVAWLVRLAEALGCHPIELMEIPGKATNREQRLLELFRTLSPEQQEAFVRLAQAFAKPREAKRARFS